MINSSAEKQKLNLKSCGFVCFSVVSLKFCIIKLYFLYFLIFLFHAFLLLCICLDLFCNADFFTLSSQSPAQVFFLSLSNAAAENKNTLQAQIYLCTLVYKITTCY